MTTLSIVIPVYNEEKRLLRTFNALNKWRVFAGFKVNQIIFVNDGSTDKSAQLIKQTKIKFPKKLISYKQNMGKGFAVKTGMLASTSDCTLLMDADLAVPLTEFKKFIPFIKRNIDLAIGTRKNGRSTVTIHQPIIRENMGKVFTKLSQITLGVKVTDFTCGFKAFSKEAKDNIFPRAQINRWGYDSEVLFLANKLGFSMIEKSVVWADQKGTKVNLFRDTISSLAELMQIRVNYLKGLYHLHKNCILYPNYATEK